VSPISKRFPRACLAAALLLALPLSSCVPAQRRPTWAIYPLQRSQPHDGLAVVSQPDGYGVHLWLATDTSQKGVCRPRWLADPARLFNGNGNAPFSSGLASRAEFFAVVARKDVQRALRRELEALCRSRAPRAEWRWSEPPRNPAQVKQPSFPLVEEPDLLPAPSAIRQQEEAMLQGAPPETSP
jgi:hypothetical protein